MIKICNKLNSFKTMMKKKNTLKKEKNKAKRELNKKFIYIIILLFNKK